MPSDQKFPRPWRVEESKGVFVVRDARDVVVARVEVSPSMTRHEAKAIAEGMVKSADVLASASEIQCEAKM